jgi:hypothetical protein
VFLRRLGAIVKPEHAWGAIYLVLFGYLVCLGLVNWLVGRRSRGFLLPTGFFLATVGLTSGLFSFVARRGSAVDEAVHTVSYARLIDGTAYDVTQWCNVFARRGAYYRITHPGGLSLYSTCQMFEAVRGRISAEGGGAFMVDIPVSSSRGFLHRCRMEAPDLGLRLARWEGSGSARKLEFGVGPGFPDNPERMWACIGGRFVSLVRRDSGLTAADAPYADRDSFSGEALFRDDYYAYGPYGNPERQDAREIFRNCAMPLLAWATGGTDDFRYSIPQAEADPDAVDVFVYAASPPQLHANDIGLGDEAGYVMYHVRLFRPEGTDD